MDPLIRDRVIRLLLLHNVNINVEDEGNNWLIVDFLFVQDCHLLDDDPVSLRYVGQGTRWEASHDCDFEECRGVDEVDACAFMLILCYISQNHAPLSQQILWHKVNGSCLFTLKDGLEERPLALF